MQKYRIIGNMTGNSMDAIDLVLTEFYGDNITDCYSYSCPFSAKLQHDMEQLRLLVKNKTKQEILALDCFDSIHDTYIKAVADAINTMCDKYHIDKKSIDAIGFHGKTLDHNPPSKARKDNSQPYTLQIGSGQMLSNLTGIPVVYDFRSEALKYGFEGAPLIAPHNAHISKLEGDGCYYNGGNTSNFSWVINGKSVFSTDAGPFNEYTDSYIRKYTNDNFDINGKYGLQGHLDTQLLQKLFDICKDFYESGFPKSGDPQYYKTEFVFNLIKDEKHNFYDVVNTLEYFAAYISVYSVCFTPNDLELPNKIILFGGGWKNPVVRNYFDDLLHNVGYILPEHKNVFESFLHRFNKNIEIIYSKYGEMMEARMCADMAKYKIENKSWECPEFVNSQKSIICGVFVKPNNNTEYTDKINQAAKQ
ncbi:MAG: anhydro-N-acetylmuramic acid kinase [Alphaproteobacteria bacterium]|nr:anhydro-N-acetylmuramic acid kinase [Alphaproteobacteria bacterium]